MKKNLVKIVTLVAVVGLVSSCSLFRKKSTTDEAGTGSTVSTETTASGGSETLDTTPMNFSAQGSDSGSIDGLNTVFFDYDSASLTPAEKTKLENNVAWMKKNSGSKILVEGHCDHRGSTEYNLSLGERRANAVKKMLTDLGVPASRLTTVSFGKEKPLVQGETEEAMAKNRRANFVPSN